MIWGWHGSVTPVRDLAGGWIALHFLNLNKQKVEIILFWNLRPPKPQPFKDL